MNSPDRPKRPRFRIAVSEMIVIVSIWAILFAFVLPPINSARDRKGEPQIIAWLSPLYDDHPWYFVLGFPVFVVFLFICCVLIVRKWLPQRVRDYFPWRNIDRPE